MNQNIGFYFKNLKMREKTFKLSKAFIEYSNTSNDVYNNINDTIQIRTEKIKLFLMILLLVLTLIKNFKPWLKNYLLDVGN